MPQSASLHHHATRHINHLAADRPWHWLAMGWSDLWRMPLASMGYSLVFVGLGYLMAFGLYRIDYFYLVLPLSAGFMLVAPILAVGFYEISRSLEQGRTASMAAMFLACRDHIGPLSAMGAVLMVLLLVWMRLSLLIFSLMFAGLTPTWDRFVETVFMSTQGMPFLLVGGAFGLIFAIIVFAISAISIPQIYERGTNVVDAMLTSMAAVRSNGPMMMLWAGLIVLLTTAGLMLAFIGLLVTLPVVGFATWHAYRELVEQEP